MVIRERDDYAEQSTGERPFTLSMDGKALSTSHSSLRDLIRFAYHAKSYDQIVGAPDWIKTELYDVTAAWGDSTFAAVNALPDEQSSDAARRMVGVLLADRFQLRTTIQTRHLPVYALVVVKGSPKLEPDMRDSIQPSLIFSTPTRVTATAQDMQTLADFLSILDELGGRAIVDETGLKGKYDFVIDGVSPARSRNPGTTSIFAAIRDQLGLALELREATDVEVVVIDHAQRPL